MNRSEFLSLAACGLLVLNTARADTVLPAVTIHGERADRLSGEVIELRDSPVGGADLAERLRDLSGFNVSRVGGTAGSVFLRGLGGARLPVVVGDAVADAACNHGMDPVTSYLQPDAYDRLTVVKGPNTVQFGPALSGLIRVERDAPEPGVRLRASATRSGFDRLDQAAEVSWAGERLWLRAGGTRNDSDNYRDGAGRRFQSFYSRYATTLAAGLKMGPDTVLEVDSENGDAIAGYPAFHMDGTRFNRSIWGAKLTHRRPGQLLSALELSLRWQDIQHLMDDYSYRPVKPVELVPGVLDQFPTLLMRQDQRGRSARAVATFEPADGSTLLLGVDARDDHHFGDNLRTTRTCFTGTTNCPLFTSTRSAFYTLDARNQGAFAELTQRLGTLTLRAGLRSDRLQTRAGELRNFLGTQLLSGSFDERTEKLGSGFLRAQLQHGDGLESYLALGVAQRAASSLERASFAAFHIDAETNTELGAGLNGRSDALQWSLHAFVSRVDDFILAEQGTRALNVDARRFGGELEARWRLLQSWSVTGAASWVRADNLTQHVPLAQTSPPEMRLGLEYDSGRFSAATQLRLVRRQDRVHVGYGNALGNDIGETPGFATVRVMAGWSPDSRLQLSAGIDNLFDRSYAEHISRTGVFQPAGFVQTERVNEPGRLAWLRARLAF